jgi:hypothetical protein
MREARMLQGLWWLVPSVAQQRQEKRARYAAAKEQVDAPQDHHSDLGGQEAPPVAPNNCQDGPRDRVKTRSRQPAMQTK